MFRKLAGVVNIRKASIESKLLIDPQEVQKFNGRASDWWDVNGSLHVLHSFQKTFRTPWLVDRLLVINSSLKTDQFVPLQETKILDTGCGGGLLSEFLTKLGCNTTGLDVSPDLIKLAKVHSQSLQNLNYVCETVQEHAVKNAETYDIVVSSEVIEHVPDQASFVKACIRCLKPGGSLLMTTPNRTLWSRVIWIFLLEDVLKLVMKGLHSYDMFIHKDDLIKIIEIENCKVVHSTGFKYKFIKREFAPTSSEKIGYALHAIKPK